jgi:transcription antitermination factor NusG
VYPVKVKLTREWEKCCLSPRWFAIGLRSNFEKTTAQLLESQGFEALSPTYRVLRRWSDRVKEIQVPFFPGYVFCRMDLTERAAVLMTPGVVRIIGHGKTAEPIPDAEITAIRAITESHLFSQPWPFLGIGDRIVVERGPLAGTEGFLTRVDGGYRLVASITLLQRSIAVELERDWVRPVDGSLRPVSAVA